ncbi:MAG: hypothetical protein ACYC3X_07750 [Pirellulaceae bacterium]
MHTTKRFHCCLCLWVVLAFCLSQVATHALWAQATAVLEQAQVRADFTCLVLGRECVDQEFVPPHSEGEVRELVQLRQQLERLA